MSTIQIDTVYRCQIDYNLGEIDYGKPGADPYQKVEHNARIWGGEEGVHVNTTSGGLAWNAYLILEGANNEAVRRVAEKVVRYIKRFKGAEIYE